MKKTKRLSALILASIITAGTVSSLSAGALAHWGDKNGMDKILAESFMIPASNNSSDHREYYVKTDEDNVYDYYDIMGQYADKISARISGNIDEESLDKALIEICPNAEYIRLTSISTINDLWVFEIAGFSGSLPYDEARKKDLTYEQVRRIKEVLDNTGEIQDFRYIKKSVSYCHTRSTLTPYMNEYDGINNKELIANYITENNLPYHIEENLYDDSCFEVVPDEKISIAEHYELSQRIYKELNILPWILVPTRVNVSEDIIIDLHNNIDGDANNDGTLALSDAIAILQNVGNPDSYGLTAQGEYNADIAGDFDGITNADALAVQRKLLGLE